MESKKDLIDLFPLIVFALVSFLLLFQLGTPKLTDWDEAWYAAISRTMKQTGNLITPLWNQEPFFEKPPLYFWLTVISFMFFGISEFAVRLPSALAGIATVLAVYYFAKHYFNKYVAIISTLIYSSTPVFLYRSRTGNFDALLTFWMFLALVGFYKGYNGRPRWYLLMGLSLALGFLTKGFISVYPLGVFLLFLLLKRKIHVIFEKQFLVSIILFMSIAGGWMLISVVVNGHTFLDQFFLSNTEKFGFGLQSLNNFSFEYIMHLKSGLKLWFPFLVFVLFYYLHKKKDKEITPLVFYFVIFLFIMSFSDNKSNWFVIPLYPVVSLIVGHTLYDITKNFFGKRSEKITLMLIFLLALVQIVLYRKDYLVPDIAGDEARVALAAKKETTDGEIVYLTNYYYPTIVYYSERKVYALYSEHERNRAWWIKPKSYWNEVLKRDNVVVITTVDELYELQKVYSKEKFEILFQSGSKLLVKKV